MPIRTHSRASAPSPSPFDGVEIRDGDLVLRTLDGRDVPILRVDKSMGQQQAEHGESRELTVGSAPRPNG